MDEPIKFDVSEVVSAFEKLHEAVQSLQPAWEYLIVVSVKVWRYSYMRYLMVVWRIPYPLAVWWSNHIPEQWLPDLEKMWNKMILRELNEDRTG